jgi:hypothetical protein
LFAILSKKITQFLCCLHDFHDYLESFYYLSGQQLAFFFNMKKDLNERHYLTLPFYPFPPFFLVCKANEFINQTISCRLQAAAHC